MNYSIMPEESLLPKNDKELVENKVEVQFEDVIMEIDITSGELLRLISSNPEDYVHYQPGLKIDFIPQIL